MLYICKEENYGANGNFTRYVPLEPFNPLTPNGIRQLKYYKFWANIFAILVLLQSALLLYDAHKFHTIDASIQKAFREHLE